MYFFGTLLVGAIASSFAPEFPDAGFDFRPLCRHGPEEADGSTTPHLEK